MSAFIVASASESSSPRRLAVAYLLWLAGFCGFCGLHRWYCGRRASAVLYFVTLGLCGFGHFLDWFRIGRMVREANLPAVRYPARGAVR